jgi:triosephosphate isomerase
MKNLIVANWKMNPVKLKEAEKLFDSINRGVKGIKNTEVVICPPFIYLPLLKGIKTGAQDCFWENKGAYTGEISPTMLKNLACQYVIIGHSERRKYFQETDETVNKKVKAALESGLNVILCVGETEEEREQDKAEQILHQQIVAGLINIPVSRISQLNIAYEPIWAIGTGNACDPEEAQKTGLLIRKIISKTYNLPVSKKMRILYGGSVKSNNAESYLKEAGFQGLLVGGASLDSKEFLKIVTQT